MTCHVVPVGTTCWFRPLVTRCSPFLAWRYRSQRQRQRSSASVGSVPHREHVERSRGISATIGSFGASASGRPRQVVRVRSSASGAVIPLHVTGRVHLHHAGGLRGGLGVRTRTVSAVRAAAHASDGASVPPNPQSASKSAVSAASSSIRFGMPARRVDAERSVPPSQSSVSDSRLLAPRCDAHRGAVGGAGGAPIGAS